MNERKDILEKVKYIMKESNEMKINCSKLARQLNCDRRTVSRYIDMVAEGQESSVRQYAKKTDGFEQIIEEKVKTTAPAIAIFNYLVKEHGFTGSYSTINVTFYSTKTKMWNKIIPQIIPHFPFHNLCHKRFIRYHIRTV